MIQASKLGGAGQGHALAGPIPEPDAATARAMLRGPDDVRE